uniref:Hyp23 n=1 Tax=Moniliophthora roreri (strain MCA 2997) TaxID=1381753 RepID=F2WVL8_MONRO|nr:hyp23 [Moniliophthora roreri]ADO51606.1 hyp23 [Moniliophthora roreri]
MIIFLIYNQKLIVIVKKNYMIIFNYNNLISHALQAGYTQQDTKKKWIKLAKGPPTLDTQLQQTAVGRKQQFLFFNTYKC